MSPSRLPPAVSAVRGKLFFDPVQNPTLPLSNPRSLHPASVKELNHVHNNIAKSNNKRRHDHSDKDESSSGSGDEAAHGKYDKRRHPAVKRACNECRQQKLKCDVVAEPSYISCKRCRRLQLECRIDSNFKRIGKRSRNAEMEREITDLKRQLATVQQKGATAPQVKIEAVPEKNGSSVASHTDTFMGSEEAVASLLDLASGQEGGSFLRSENAKYLMHKRLGDVVLNQDQIHELFQIFFAFYHPFLPLFDPSMTPDDYFSTSKLLFWAIVSVAARHYASHPKLLTQLAPHVKRLLWEQISDVPQSYIFVKAVCIFCSWPLPISSTSSDPTFMLSGLNLHIAMQIGLHRPSHMQDFSKFKAELVEDELRDRVRTWASATAIAQRVATGYGQPPATFYDWTLQPKGVTEPGFTLHKSGQNRVLIEKFSSRVTNMLYRNDSDPVGLVSDEARIGIVEVLTRDYQEVERRLESPDSFSFLYLRAAGLHMRLCIFFACPSSKDYLDGLRALWNATTEFLENAFQIEGEAGKLITYATNYVLQMIIASAFTLLKLLNSFFASYVDLEYGRNLFVRVVRAIRNISVAENDLPSRLAEVLAQLWRTSGAGAKKPAPTSHAMENSLQLKVKCRMSMSLVFDSVWRWREEFQAQGKGNLEAAVHNPTNPDSNAESSATSVADNAPTPFQGPLGDAIPAGTLPPDNITFGDNCNSVFDPLNWMFDGLVDFPAYNLTTMTELEDP